VRRAARTFPPPAFADGPHEGGVVAAPVDPSPLYTARMFGAPASAPSTGLVLAVVLLAAGALLVGAVTAGRWPERAARHVRATAAVLLLVVPLVWTVLAPAGSGVEGAARLVFVWAPVGLGLLCAWLWSRRSPRAAARDEARL
jgi:hypothetical protein